MHEIKLSKLGNPVSLEERNACRETEKYSRTKQKKIIYHIYLLQNVSYFCVGKHTKCHLQREKIPSTSSSTFLFIIPTLHYQPRWFLDELRGCKNMSGGEGKKRQNAGGGRLKRSTVCKRTNTGGVCFPSLQQIKAAE